MAFLKIFKQSFIDSLARQISEGRGFDLYKSDEPIVFEESDVLWNNKVVVPENMALIMPDSHGKHDFKNAKNVFDSLKNLDPTMASDPRLWTYLSHVTFSEYMNKRWPVSKAKNGKTDEYILKHWFIRNLNARSLIDNGIAVLWWGAYMTYDENREDKYELTRELFSMLDYTRTLLTGSLGRDKKYLHAFLEYSIENKDFFKNHKQNKARSFMRKMNFVAGYKAITSLSIDEIKNNISKYKETVGSEFTN